MYIAYKYKYKYVCVYIRVYILSGPSTMPQSEIAACGSSTRPRYAFVSGVGTITEHNLLRGSRHQCSSGCNSPICMARKRTAQRGRMPRNARRLCRSTAGAGGAPVAAAAVAEASCRMRVALQCECACVSVCLPIISPGSPVQAEPITNAEQSSASSTLAAAAAATAAAADDVRDDANARRAFRRSVVRRGRRFWVGPFI